MKTVYDLIIDEKWTEAKETAIENFNRTNNFFELRNLIPVLLMRGEYSEALTTIDKIWEFNQRDSENEYMWLAVINVYLNNLKGAYDSLVAARKCRYTDEAGGIGLEAMIYSISYLMSDSDACQKSLDNIKVLTNGSKHSLSSLSLIGDLLLDKIDSAKFMSFASADGVFRKLELVRMYFYLAIKAFVNEEYGKMREDFKELDNYLPNAYFVHEYHLSKAFAIFLNRHPSYWNIS